jgi:hypothetical protein
MLLVDGDERLAGRPRPRPDDESSDDEEEDESQQENAFRGEAQFFKGSFYQIIFSWKL